MPPRAPPAEPTPPTLPVAVVVVAWNSGPGLLACLASASAEAPQEILVVDNASTDASIAAVRRTMPHVRILAGATNSGFAAACNLGVACSTAPYVLFLNDDARLLPGYLATLVAALEARQDAASATGKLVLAGPGPRRIDSAGITLGAHALRPLDRGHGALDVGQFDRPGCVFGPSGAAALFRRRALASVSGAAGDPFDAGLFAYYEDVDLAWRLGKRGWLHLYAPRAVAVHSRRGPGNKPPAIRARAFVNRYRVWRKNESWRRFARYGAVAVAWETVRLARLGLREPRALGHIVRALLTPGPRPA